MNAKLAIIIPAYNAEKTVERTVRNVLGQTLREIEVWVTDDGSTDGTGAILDRLANEDSRVCVIHQPNCGAYQARLNALKQIKTPYFGFVDADDTIEPEMYEKMLAFLERENLDVVQCEYKSRRNNVEAESNWLVLPDRDTVYEEYIYPKLLDGKESSFIWDKVYRHQYDFAKFELTNKMTNFDDLVFNLQFFLPVRRMGFVHEALYNYSMTVGSAVHSFGDKKILDLLEAINMRKKLAPKYGIPVDSPIMYAWVLLNARSGIITAVMAPGLKIAERARLVRTMVSLPEVKYALSKVGLRGISALIVQIATILPIRMLCLLVRTLRPLRKFRG